MSLQFIPQSIADIIHKNIHQLRMSTYVFPQMTSIQSHTRRLTYRLQLLANSALLTVHLHLGSIVGQHAYIHHTHTHTRTDIGLHWTLYQNRSKTYHTCIFMPHINQFMSFFILLSNRCPFYCIHRMTIRQRKNQSTLNQW